MQIKLITPTPFQAYVPEPPRGSALTRGLRAVFLERRLPHFVRRRFDRCMKAIGAVRRTSRVGDYKVTFRRASTDETFIESVLVREEYFRAGYRPAPGQTIIDIGANMGSFVLAAAKYAKGGRIIAVEPFPESVRYLRRNVQQNRLDNVEIIEAAVAASAGKNRLYMANDAGFHSVWLDEGFGSIEVRSIALAEILERYDIKRCDLLKIDCEGAEFEFIPAIQPDTWRRIRRLVMEYTVPIEGGAWPKPSAEHVIRKRELSDSLVSNLQQNGFRIDLYEDCVDFPAGFVFATQCE